MRYSSVYPFIDNRDWQASINDDEVYYPEYEGELELTGAGQYNEETEDSGEKELTEKRKIQVVRGTEVYATDMFDDEKNGQKFVKGVEESEYEEEKLKQDYLDSAEDGTKERLNGDYSQKTTKSQDYEEMMLKIGMRIEVFEPNDKSSGHANPGTKKAHPGTKKAHPGTKKAHPGTKKADPGTKKADPGTKKADPVTKKADPVTKKENNDLEKQEEGDKKKTELYDEIRDKEEEKMKENYAHKDTEITNVDVSETEQLQPSAQKKKTDKGEMDERSEREEKRTEEGVENYHYKETEEKVESTLEASELMLQEIRNMVKNKEEDNLKYKEKVMALMDQWGLKRNDRYVLGLLLAHPPPLRYPAVKDVRYRSQTPTPTIEKTEMEVESIDVGEWGIGAGRRKEVRLETGHESIEEYGGDAWKRTPELPDDKMKYKQKRDHSEDTKQRQKGRYYAEIKLHGSIRIYHNAGRRM
jgi:hypothetical protein